MKPQSIKKTVLGLFVVAALLAAGAAGGLWWAGRHAPADDTHADAPAQDGRTVLYWYDPMVPQQKFDKPGKSPFMDMELVPKYADEGGDVSTVKIDPGVAQNLGVRLAVVTRTSLGTDVHTLAHALHRHPELTVFEPKARVLEAEVAEAQAGKKPDWALELAYLKRGSQFGDMAMVNLSFDLPLFPGSRQDPQIAARQAERAALDAEREAVLREHAAMLETDLAEYQRLARAVMRQRDVLLPLAGEKVALALAAWRGGKGELTDLVMARRERIDAELMAIALEGERRQMAARLHYAYSEPDLSGEKQ